MQRNGVVECSVCHSRLVVPSPRSVSRAYDKHRSKISSKFRALNFLLVVGDCILVSLQLYFNPSTVKMLSNLKVLVIAVLLKFIMKRRFSVIQVSEGQKGTFKPAERIIN
ncbi:hypothetical protein E2562_008042 [Oryza meyeriana var. granulata]|uniref:Uncharacterized protein n=1 Tax=Oryza meyeriana var. granulata TaxID=110450 RepID=A0A6G1DFK9_9ORYZ|nr:hypothetical protein E2562_008042 [Oryza meyeriana var. granulata]